MQTAIVTGAAGFIGYHLVCELIKNGVKVYAVVRPNSPHIDRLTVLPQVQIINLDMRDIAKLDSSIKESGIVFFHLAWEGGRNDFYAQYNNINYAVQALEVAHKIGCTRFICTGSQAEYGLQADLITEATLPCPNTAYGGAKLAACHLSKIRAEQLNIDWVWPRIFSVYGKFDNVNCLIPYIIQTLKTKKAPLLTVAQHNWDYLYAPDAANALWRLAQVGKAGEVYNLASGDVHQLRYFTEMLKQCIFPEAIMNYGKASRMIVSLNPSIQKLKKDTGWQAKFKFIDGIYNMLGDE